jgi:CBS domain containing-hemolysin-like protein
MTGLSEFILNKVFKGRIHADKSSFTRLDLEHFVNSSRSEADDNIDREMFGKALNLRGTRVRECMVPRPEIESIDVEAGIQELEQLFRETKLSRILVVKGDMDNVIGYVHHQQLLGKIATIDQLVMKITFVPETMLVTELMNKMIKSRLNIVCVVDEFGGYFRRNFWGDRG